MKILIAEDDTTSRITLKEVLKKQNHDVIEADNCIIAWHIMQRDNPPKILLLDWMMPEMDGIEVIKNIRNHQKMLNPYIIILTCKSGKNNIIEGLKSGADDYLIKPFNPEELEARISVGIRTLKIQDELTLKNKELTFALQQIKTLRGILPICCNCKKIRDDKGYWSQVETYISKNTDADFSHALCPECMEKLYPKYIS